MRHGRAEEGASALQYTVETLPLSVAAPVSVRPWGRDRDSSQKAQAPSSYNTRQPFSETSLP